MTYENYEGYVIQAVECMDKTSDGEPITRTALMIRSLGYPKYLHEVSTVEEGREWIDDSNRMESLAVARMMDKA